MRRRTFIAGLGTAAAWPVVAGAQQPRKVWRIGFLAGATRPAQLESSHYAGFLRGMRELGYLERRDFVMEWRFAEARFELFPELAAELVQLNVDVIVLGTGLAVPATQRATTTIPIVMGGGADPVGLGYVSSLARPGGNVTGLANSMDDSTAKQLELLLKTAPSAARIGVAINPENHSQARRLKLLQQSVEIVGRGVVLVKIGKVEDISTAFATLSDERAGALMVLTDPFFFTQRQRIAEAAIRVRLPTIFPQREYVEAGGLMSYGESFAQVYRRAAFYVDKIMKGAKPGDLPVQQPTRFFLTSTARPPRR